MVNGDNKRIIIIIIKFCLMIIFLLLVVICILYTVKYYQSYSDSAFYALITQNIVKNNDIQRTVIQLPVDMGKYFPIDYLQTFFIVCSVYILFLGPLLNTVFINIFSLILITLFLFLIIREYNQKKDYINYICIPLIFLSSDLMILIASRVKIEPLLFAMLLSSLYSLIKFEKEKKIVWLFLATILFSTTAILKQTALLPLGLFFIFTVILLFRKKISFKKWIIILSIMGFILTPLYGYLFFSTGGFLYHSFDLGPITTVNNIATNLLSIEKIESDPMWEETYANSKIVQNRDIYRNKELNKIFLLPVYFNKPTQILLFIGLISVITIVGLMLKNNKEVFTVYLFSLIISSLLFFYYNIKIWSYFTYLEILSIILYSRIVSRITNKHIKLITIFLIILFSLIAFSTNIFNSHNSNLSNNQISEALINLNNSHLLKENELVIGPRVYEIALYTTSKPYWISPYNYPEIYENIIKQDIEGIISEMQKLNSNKLIIPPAKYRSKDYNTWVYSFPTDTYNLIKNNKNFKLIYSYKGTEVYQLKEINHAQ